MPKNGSSLLSISISYKDEVDSLEISSKEFKLSELDSWIRSRYGIGHSVKLRFEDELGKSVLPTPGFLKDCKTLYVKQINFQVPSKNDKEKGHFSISNSSYLLFTLTIALIAIFYQTVAEYLFDLNEVFRNLDDLLITSGIATKRGICLEAFIAQVGWSITYLFIRRLWNPETSKGALLRFSSDSFYGGFAAGATIILKHFLSSKLNKL